jgi:hypothetical protein
LIKQLVPAASVLPQGLVLVVRAKSPLAAMLLIFSVVAPVLLSVTVFAAAFAPTTTLPHVSPDGDNATVGPLANTVRLTAVVCVRLPDVPLIVTLAVPVAAVALAVSVKVLVEVVGFGLNPAVTPLGKPEALKLTLPVNPFVGLTVMVLLPLVPCVTVTLFGDGASVKFGLPGAQPVKMNDPMFVCQLKVPLTFSYWSTYQKVQSSLGSTTMAV